MAYDFHDEDGIAETCNKMEFTVWCRMSQNWQNLDEFNQTVTEKEKGLLF